jgi:hypothetical protein
MPNRCLLDTTTMNEPAASPATTDPSERIVIGAVLCNEHWDILRSLYDEVGAIRTAIDDAEAHADGTEAPPRNTVITYRSWNGLAGTCEAGHDRSTDADPCVIPGTRRAIYRRVDVQPGKRMGTNSP